MAQTIEWFFEGAFRPCGFSMQWEAMDRQVRSGKSLAEGELLARARFRRRSGGHCVAQRGKVGGAAAGGIHPGGAPRFTILGTIGDRTAHHRGALAVYARLRRKVPPVP